MPENAHPVRIGVDSAGGNRFHGVIGGFRVSDGVLSASDIAALAKSEPQTKAPETPAASDFKNGLSLEGWFKPDSGAAARIIDKVTAGSDDGFLFDIQPEGALRLIVGSATLLSPPNTLKPGRWQHVAATFDPKPAAMAIYPDGKPVAQLDSALSPTGTARHGLFLGQDKVSPDITSMTVGKAHTLQRYMQACAGRSVFPIKFNGSIFTVEPKPLGVNGNTDWRRWGDCHWWQNVRMPYHTMQAAGDFDLMMPLFDTFERIRPFAEARANSITIPRADISPKP